jgi:gas vesicle protein
MSAKGYWTAFVVGVSAGAAVALLYAPESGARTRKRIGRKIDSGIDAGVDTLEDAAEYLKEQAESLSKQAMAKYDRTRGQVNGAVGTIADTVAGAAKSVQSLM